MSKSIKFLLIIVLFGLMFAACDTPSDEETSTPAPPITSSPTNTPENTDTLSILPPNTFGTVDNTTYIGKVIIGYQGWFGCPGDGSEVDDWIHWFKGTPSIEFLSVDFWPDVSELTEEELCDTGFKDAQDNPMYAFSSYNPLTVLRHFYWMAQYGIDGVEQERFVSVFLNPERRKAQDQVLQNVRNAAETYGRVFYIQYDGFEKQTLEMIKEDWMNLIDTQEITSSPSYLHHKGLPLVGLFGIGFRGRDVTPEDALDLIGFFRNNPDPKYRAAVLGGVPSYWRTLTRDSSSDPAWAEVYRSLDIINPWHVNSIYDEYGADVFLQNVIIPDLEETRALGIDYLPVILPGFSWNNLNADGYNKTPRNGGTFFWKLAYNVISQDVDMILVAMFDEVDEGTAIFKMVETADQLPEGQILVPLDVDGYDLPSDWYLILAGRITQMLRGEIPLTAEIEDFPGEDISDYFRLHLEITTGGDWNTLEILNSEVINSIEVISRDGVFTHLSAETNAISLNQSLEDAQAGKTISVHVKILLDPAVGFDTLELILEKGSIGTANLRFYTVTDGIETTIKEISHYVTNDGTGRNPLEISLSFDLIE